MSVPILIGKGKRGGYRPRMKRPQRGGQAEAVIPSDTRDVAKLVPSS